MKTQKKSKGLLEIKFKRLLIANLLGWLVYFVGAIGDNVFSGNLLGTDALAAVEVVLPFYSFIAFVSSIFSVGCSIKYAHLVGENKSEEAHRVFGLGLVISIILGLLMAAAMFFFKDAFLDFFNLSSSVRAYASDYYNWFLFIAFFYPIYMVVYQTVAQDGDATFTVLADIAQATLNLLVSYVVVKTTGSINGLGIGTFVGFMSSLICVSLHFFRKTNSIRLRFKLNWGYIKDMVKFGFATSISMLFVAALDIVLNAYICKRFGDSFLQPYSMVNLCINFTELFLGVTSTISPFISVSYGAKNNDDIKHITKLGLKWSFICTLPLTVVLAALCWLVPNLYGITSEAGELYTMSEIICLTIPLTFMAYTFNYLVDNYYISFGKSLYASISQALAEFLLPLIIGVALSLTGLGFYGLIIGFVVAPLIVILIMIPLIKHNNKDKKLFSLPNVAETQFSYDGVLTNEFVIQTRDSIKNKLGEIGISNKTILRVMACVEDALFMILKENGESQKILDRVTICVGEKVIRIINKDNGKVFDLASYSKMDTKVPDNLILYNTTLKKSKYFQNSLQLSFNANQITLKKEY